MQNMIKSYLNIYRKLYGLYFCGKSVETSILFARTAYHNYVQDYFVHWNVKLDNTSLTYISQHIYVSHIYIEIISWLV